MMTFANLTQLPQDKRWHGQKYPVPVVLALIKHNDSFLLIKRNSPPYLGMWALVGGKWDFGEQFETALIREVSEETGLATEFVAWRGFVNELVQPEGEPAGAHFFLFVGEVAPLPDQIAAEQFEGAVGWFSHSDIDTLHEEKQIIPSDYLMIQQFGQAQQRLPYAEVEMVTDTNYDNARLARFDNRR